MLVAFVAGVAQSGLDTLLPLSTMYSTNHGTNVRAQSHRSQFITGLMAPPLAQASCKVTMLPVYTGQSQRMGFGNVHRRATLKVT